MARFEKERDPQEIQERLSLAALDTRDPKNMLNDDLPDCKNHDNPQHSGRHYRSAKPSAKERSKQSQRFSPYPTSSSCMSKSNSCEEKTMKSSPGHKVFVANLSFSTTEKMLSDHMSKVGSVLKVVLFKNPNGSSKGMGIVQYREEESIDRAVAELRDTELDTRMVYVRKHMEEEERERCGFVTINRPIDRPRPPANPSATVFINNLDYNCSWQQIKDVFKAAGKIVYCEIQLDKEGNSKGMASVQFERPIEALNSIALFHGQVLFNRALMVRMDNRSPIKPDSMTIKQMFGGGLSLFNQSSPLALLGGGVSGLGMSIIGMSSGMGMGPPDLLKSLRRHDGDSLNSFSGINVANGGYFPCHKNTSTDCTSERTHAPPLLPSPPTLFRINDGDYPNNDVRNGTSVSVGVAGTTPTNRAWQDSTFLYTKTPPTNERRIVIKNLNFKTPWQRLKDVFRGAGRVQFVDIMQGPDGRPNGIAFVLFDGPDEASKAIEMFHNSELDGRKIEVQMDRFSKH